MVIFTFIREGDQVQTINRPDIEKFPVEFYSHFYDLLFIILFRYEE